MPAQKVNHRSSARPSPICRIRLPRSRPSRTASSSAPVASTGLVGGPSARAKTLVLPPGDDGHRRDVGSRPVGEEAVDDLVDRAVPTQGDHELDAVLMRLAGQVDGVAARAGWS
jgi:hypothetical protein